MPVVGAKICHKNLNDSIARRKIIKIENKY